MKRAIFICLLMTFLPGCLWINLVDQAKDAAARAQAAADRAERAADRAGQTRPAPAGKP